MNLKPTLAVASLAFLLLAGCSGGQTATVTHTSTVVTTNAAGETVTTTTTSQEVVQCSSSGRATVNQAGSSTVFPIAQRWAEKFGCPLKANIVVGGGGSGAGINRFCRGELDIADASRPMRDAEKLTCRNAGIEPFEVQVAIDGLSVVVPVSNTWAECLTVAQLNKVWTADAGKQANTWKQLNPAWPDQKIDLYGPGPDSGTFDYFVEVIITPFDGASTKGRSDYTPSEDDNVLVKGVSESPYGLGYFGLSYAKENSKNLRIVKVDEGKGAGCVEPTDANVEGGKYSPLSRPLFMYTKGKPAGVLKGYFEKALSAEGQDIAHAVGYIKLPSAKLDEMRAKIA